MKHLFALIPLVFALGCSPQSSHAADKTGASTQGSSGTVFTPPDQYENEVDQKITQNVRKALMADSNLSASTTNIKITTDDGMVTLRGVVASAAERKGIVAKAKSVVGVKELVDQLEVKSN